MIKRSFFCFSKPWLAYSKISGPLAKPQSITPSRKAVLTIRASGNRHDTANFKAGDRIKTGQRLALSSDANGEYVISTVTGTIAGVSRQPGDFGRSMTEIVVNVDQKEEFDTSFSEASSEPDLNTIKTWLATAPGNPSVAAFERPDKPIRTIVVNGVDGDLLTTSVQHTVTSGAQAVEKGIHILKEITGIEDVRIVVPRDIVQGFGHMGARMASVDKNYPSGHPALIMKNVLGISVPEGKSSEDFGVTFMGAQAVASIGSAFENAKVPVDKTVTVVGKDGSSKLFSVRIGTPVGDVLAAAGIEATGGDRIIFGGPMTGSAIYSEDQPVAAGTDAIIVQDGKAIPFVSDYPCINCGECVRICPAGIQPNMIVRFLEAGQYEDAADLYDLYSCIECGLCSFVCVAKIPIFQYIRLGKYELERVDSAEEVHE